MKKFLLAFILLLSAKADGQVTFQKMYGGIDSEIAYAVQQTTDGGYIITGGTYSFDAGDGDVYLIKTDAVGDTLWTKTFGGIGVDWGTSVKQTSDSGYIITGNTSSFGVGGYDVYLIKTDVNGDSVWTKTIGGSNIDHGNSVQQTSDGGYIIAGNTRSFGAGNIDVYLIKTDTNGNLIWTKTFGGTDSDYGNSVQQTADGGYILTGYTYALGAGYTDAYLIKTDFNGNSSWIKTFGGTGDDRGYSVQQTSNGGYVVAGQTNSFGLINSDVYIILTDINGDTLWSKTFGGIGDDFGNSIQQSSDGGYVVAGYTTSFGIGYPSDYLIKVDSSGNLSWSKTFGGTNSEYLISVQETLDGGYIATGISYSFGANNGIVYLIKTDGFGNSGCNQSSPATMVSFPGTILTSPAIIVTSPNSIITSPATLVSSGGIVTTLCTTVGFQSEIVNQKYEISLSPNPSSGAFKINYALNQNHPGRLDILDVTGKIIYTQTLPAFSTTQSILLPRISNGVYNCVITSGDKRENKKLVVMK